MPSGFIKNGNFHYLVKVQVDEKPVFLDETGKKKIETKEISPGGVGSRVRLLRAITVWC